MIDFFVLIRKKKEIAKIFEIHNKKILKYLKLFFSIFVKKRDFTINDREMCGLGQDQSVAKFGKSGSAVKVRTRPGRESVQPPTRRHYLGFQAKVKVPIFW